MDTSSGPRLAQADLLRQSVLNLKSAYELRIWFKLHFCRPRQANVVPSRRVWTLSRADIENVLTVLQKFAPQLDGFLTVTVQFLPKTSLWRKRVQNLLKIVSYLRRSSSANQLMIAIGESNLPLLGHFFTQLAPFILNRWTFALFSVGSMVSAFFFLNGISIIKQFVGRFFQSNDNSAEQRSDNSTSVALSRVYNGVVSYLTKVISVAKVFYLHLAQLLTKKMDKWKQLDVQQMTADMKTFFMTIGSVYSSASSTMDFTRKMASKYFVQFIQELFSMLKNHERNARMITNYY